MCSRAAAAPPEGIRAVGDLGGAHQPCAGGGRVQRTPACICPHDWQHAGQWEGLWPGSRLPGALLEGWPPRIRILRRGEEPVQVFPADFWPFLSFFQLHLRLLSKDAEVMAALVSLSSRLEAGWTELRASMDQSLCLLAYAKSALLWQPTCFFVSFSFCIFIKVCWRVFPGCVFFFCPKTKPKIDRCTLLIQTLETTLLQHWKKSTRQQTRLIMLKTFI